MTAHPSKPSKHKPASACFELDPLNTGHPARTKICNGWETICAALEELPLVERTMIALELERRINEKGIEMLRTLKRDHKLNAAFQKEKARDVD